MGKYSFCMYVIHQPLIPVFERLFPPKRLAELAGNGVAGLALFLFLAGGITYALFDLELARIREALHEAQG